MPFSQASRLTSSHRRTEHSALRPVNEAHGAVRFNLHKARVFPRLDSGELYKQLESSEKQIFEACAPFGAGISAGFEDVLRGCRSTDGK